MKLIRLELLGCIDTYQPDLGLQPYFGKMLRLMLQPHSCLGQLQLWHLRDFGQV
jgi:hypothetical protein